MTRKKISKNKSVLNKKIAKPAVKKNIKTPVVEGSCNSHFNVWSLSIYIYWFIILFFISATFYILGRSHGLMNPIGNGNITMTEEALKSQNDYAISGKEKLISGKIDESISDFDAALNTDNPSSDVFIMRGEAYMQIGDYQNAMSDFNDAIRSDQDNASAYYDRAILRTRLEDFSGALGDINSALAASSVKADVNLPLRDIYAKRGKLNLWLKNWHGAVADYTNSLSRPEGIIDASVYAERAEAYTALNNYSAAINDYTSAVRVISEQIQGAANREMVEDLSRRAMGYFEKSAALNVRINDMVAAKQDLESAYTIAISLNDEYNTERLQSLISDLG